MKDMRENDAMTTVPAADLPVAGWRVRRYGEVTSTNDLARDFPPWSVVCAETQTHGRGRTGRPWVSDRGGLWMTAVMPTPGDRRRWEILPLAVGWAVLRTMWQFGVEDARLRWPNDIMVGRRKLAGLLVERYHEADVAVGIGLNMRNSPECGNADLAGMTVRLDELVALPPAETDILAALLPRLREAQAAIAGDRFAPLCAEMNRSWAPVTVDVTLTGRPDALRGQFEGVTADGSLRLRRADGTHLILPASRVALLREVF